MVRLYTIAVMVSLSLLGPCLAYAKEKKYEKVDGALSALIQVSKDQKEMALALKDETRNYNRIETAVRMSELKPGEYTSDISARFGEPVVILAAGGEEPVKWIYKPASSSFFSDKQVWLLFDGEGKLLSAGYPPKKN